LPQGIIDGFAEVAFGKDVARGFDFPKGFAEPPINGKGLADTNPLPLGGTCAVLTQLCFDLIEVLDLP